MAFHKFTGFSVRLPYLLMLALLLMAWGMWVLVIIPRTSMHPDESWTFDYMVAQSPVELVQILTHDTHPPMWWIIFWTWHHLTGGSEFAGRWLGAFFGLLTLSLVYRLGGTWFKDARYGLFAVIVLMFSAPFVWLSIEIRPYSLLFFLSSYSMFAFRRWMLKQTWPSAVMYAAVCAMLMYIHYYLIFLMVAQVGYWLLSRPSRRLVSQGFGVAALALLIWSPWSLTFIRQVTQLKAVTPSEQGGIGFIPTTWVTNWTTITKLFTTLANGYPWLPIMLIGLGVVLLWRKPAYRLLLIWGIIPLTLLLLINLRIEVFTLRYISYALVGIVVAGGMALAALPRRLGSLLVGAAAVLLVTNLTQYLPTHAPYRDVFQFIATQAHQDDVIYMDFTDNSENHLERQIQLYMPQEIHDQLVSDVSPDTPARRIWYVTNALFTADKQEHLQSLSDGTRVVKMSKGECSPRYCLVANLFEGPQLAIPKTFGDHINFYGLDIQSLSAEQVDVILWWRFDSRPNFDYSIGVYLLDKEGRVVSQTDGSLHNYYGDQDVALTTVDLDHYYLDVRHLAIPADLARDTPYTLAIAVYDWRNGERLSTAEGELLSVGSLNLPAKD